MDTFSRQSRFDRTLAASLHRQRIITLAIVAAITAAIVALSAIPLVHLSYVEKDTANCPVRTGIGIVSSVRNVRGNWISRFQIGDLSSLDVQTDTSFQTGQRVSVRYRVGKSGNLYVGGVTPIEPRK